MKRMEINKLVTHTVEKITLMQIKTHSGLTPKNISEKS